MRTREQFNFLLSDEKRKVNVEVCAYRKKLTATVARSDDQLHIAILPKVSNAEERCEAAKANISVKWRTAKDEYQEVSFSIYHEFSEETRAKWRLRLDAYLPFLEDSYVIPVEPTAKDGPSAKNVHSSQDLRSSMDTEATAGVITVNVNCVAKEELSLWQVYPIESGKLKMQGAVVAVSKELLALHSPYFAILFYGDFKERNMEVIEIKDVDLESFKNVVEIISNRESKPEYDEEWVFAMKTADRLEMLGVVKICETNLLNW